MRGVAVPHRHWTAADPMRAGGWPSAGVIWVVVGCALSLLSVLLLDGTAARWSHEHLHGAWMFRALTHVVDPVPPLASLGFVGLGLAALAGRRGGPVSRALLQACIATLVAILIKDQLKYAFGRPWPETWVNDNPSWIRDGVYAFVPFHGGAGWSSFPSGHMTAITAPAAVLWRCGPSWRAVAAVPVVLVTVGLYGADFHFIGDIVAGTTLGAACAALVIALMPGEGSRAAGTDGT